MHINFSPDSPPSSPITFDEFLKVDIRLGEIVEDREFPEARNPSYKLKINFGTVICIKNCSAQITAHYKIEDLKGKKVLAVVNFPPRQIGKFMSEVLLLGVSDEQENVVLFTMDKSVPNGARLH